MTADEAFVKFLHARADHDLPWMVSTEDMRPIFMAAYECGYANGVALRDNVTAAKAIVSPVLDMPDATVAEIWAAWPVKKAKGAAVPAITKALKKVSGMKLLEAVEEMARAYATWPVAERQYLPMCSTWMNQERWLDDRSTWLRGAAAVPSQYSKTYQ